MGQGNSETRKTTDSGVDSSLDQFVSSVDAFQETIGRLNDRYRDLEERYLDINRQLENTNQRLLATAEENRRFGEYLDCILRGIEGGVVAVDETGTIRFYNRAAERLLGVETPTVIGASFETLFPKIHVQPPKHPSDNSEFDLAYQHPNTGAKLQLAVSAARIPGEQEKHGLVYLFRDLTRSREMEGEISRLRTLAALGEMSATLAHEIRNPLTGVAGYCGLLLRELKPGPHRNWAAKIEEGVNRLDSLIMRMLEFARLPQVDRRPIKWRAFSEEIANAFEDGTLKKRITLVRKFPERWPESTGDPSLLRQAVLNLLHNAAEAVDDGGEGEIQLRVYAAEDGVALEVVDNGRGMNPETLAQAFQPFFTTRVQGTGLGLAITRKIVEAHGGTIDADSQPGRGTEFKILLPCRN